MLLPHYYTGKIEAGCDEAGRGCLAGPVYAAAVILPEDYHNEELNDSKQLTDKRRHLLRKVIERDAISWAVGVCSAEEIDRINILHASFLAMHRAIAKLEVAPEALIIDGNRFDPYYPTKGERYAPAELRYDASAYDTQAESATITGETCESDMPLWRGAQMAPLPYKCIVKGDGKYLSIAAASILAKTYRDDFMDSIAADYPEYDWLSNKGYPTKKHREAIREHGLTPWHRRTFSLLG